MSDFNPTPDQLRAMDQVMDWWKLKKGGYLFIVNLYATTSVSRFWGYGISPEQLLKIFNNKFRNVKFMSNTLKQNGEIGYTSLIKTPDLGYSCTAEKLV